ncbi:transmembrane protein 45B [Arapaima gigas]
MVFIRESSQAAEAVGELARGNQEPNKMANFKGHALPGSFFLLFGLWWSVKYPLRHCWKKRLLGARQQMPKFFNRLEFIEGVLKVFFAFVGIMAEQFVPDGPHAHLYNTKDQVWVKLMNWQHSTMYLFYGISGIADILSTSPLPVPQGLDRLCLSFALFVEGFLFYFHVQDRPHLDKHIHSLLLVAVFGGSASCFLEVFKRDHAVLELFRSSMAILQGTWFFQIGFVLFPFSGKEWDQELHDNIMFITMCFCWHYAVSLMIMAANYTFVWIGVQRYIARQSGDMEINLLKISKSNDVGSQKALLQDSEEE